MTSENDKPDGPWAENYPNGQKKSEGHYKDGTGLVRAIYKDGELVNSIWAD